MAPLGKAQHAKAEHEVSLAWGEGSVPLGLALESLEIPEAKHH